MGVIKDDVLRVNVTNLNATTQQAQVTVMDEKGLTKGKTTLTLDPGVTGFFDVTFSEIVGRLMVRTQAKCSNNLFQVSTEIYVGLGVVMQTSLTLSGSSIVINGQGLFPAIGIVDGETARVSVANLGTTTAEVTLDFIEQDGKVIKEAILSVAPKQTGFLDYDGDGILGKMILRATGGAGAGTCVMSMEVFDTLSGRTRFSVDKNY